MYSKLRANVLNNIVRQYHTTGYLWENYDDETGRGKGSHPFTGCDNCIYCSRTITVQSICLALLGVNSAADREACLTWLLQHQAQQPWSLELPSEGCADTLQRCCVPVDCRWTALFVLVAGETYD